MVLPVVYDDEVDDFCDLFGQVLQKGENGGDDLGHHLTEERHL